ncbi:MAG: pyridoxamine 5'-phosphate oxidase family protein [Marinilabiliaceae bacterium]|nr:pyridoxamine 5'-phosphate oxidase family protein [Marinilabiliaceae bacterium]
MQTLVYNDQDIIEAIINKCDICFIGVCDKSMIPYVLPMNFGYNNNTIYLHSAPNGKVIDIINENNNICITFSTDHELAFQHPEVACSYRMKSKSVIAFGKVEFIADDDLDKKREALNIIMKQYSNKEFQYNDPAVRNVRIWKIPVNQITCKEFGAPHDQYKIQRGIEALKNLNNKKL